MNKLSILILFCMFVGSINAQDASATADSTGITATALNYADGFYSGDAARMEKAIHPDLHKVCPAVIPQTGKTFLLYSTWSELIELSRSKAGFLEETLRKIKVRILRINDDVACAMLTSAQFNDYLIMGKIDNQWKIITVLWTFGEDSKSHIRTDFNSAAEKSSIERTLRNLTEGVYTNDVTAVENALHPEYTRSTFLFNPKTGKYIIQKDAASRLIESVNAKLGSAPKDKWNIKINVLNSMDGISLAEMTTTSGTSYYQLAKIDGNWKVINAFRKFILPN